MVGERGRLVKTLGLSELAAECVHLQAATIALRLGMMTDMRREEVLALRAALCERAGIAGVKENDRRHYYATSKFLRVILQA